MHELAIATGIVELIQKEVAKRGLSKVTEVALVVGELTNVVPEALEFCFEVASQETAAAGAKLLIETRPITARCKACGTEFPVKNYSFICPACGSRETEQTGGNELYVDHLIAD
ncbi:MAG: hydrogenase maturation nickel metallochaperone HypA [Chitinophagales bacterium]